MQSNVSFKNLLCCSEREVCEDLISNCFFLYVGIFFSWTPDYTGDAEILQCAHGDEMCRPGCAVGPEASQETADPVCHSHWTLVQYVVTFRQWSFMCGTPGDSSGSLRPFQSSSKSKLFLYWYIISLFHSFYHKHTVEFSRRYMTNPWYLKCLLKYYFLFPTPCPCRVNSFYVRQPKPLCERLNAEADIRILLFKARQKCNAFLINLLKK